MSEMVKDVEGINTYGNRNAIVKTGSRYVVAIYNKHHSSWQAGNAIGNTPEAAVDYATSDSLTKYRTIKAAEAEIAEGY